MSLHSGHEVVHLSKKDEDNIKQKFPGYKDGVIKLNPGGWFYTSPFSRHADKYSTLKLHPDDVFVLTYPKCGTTWTLETVWTMRNNPNLDNPEAEESYNFRTPFLEFDFIMDNSNVTAGSKTQTYRSEKFRQEVCKKRPGKDVKVEDIFFHLSDSLERPRTIKTHLPFALMPKGMLDKCKVVYVIRHPKDVCKSFHHHHKLYAEVQGFVGTYDEFIDFFINDDVLFGPFWEHIKEAWSMRHHPNLYICFFEEMKKSPIAEIKRLNDFLGTNLTEEQFEKVAQHTSFSSMQKKSVEGNSHVDNDSFTNMEYAKENGGFFRKGKAGDWKDSMTKAQNEKMDKWIASNISDMDAEFRKIFYSL